MNGLQPQEQVRPEYNQNFWGKTFAMFLAENGEIPPAQWRHNPLLSDSNGETVAIKLAKQGIVPPKEWSHQPEYQDRQGWTVAMGLVNKKKYPPKEWHHDPRLRDKGTNLTIYDRMLVKKMLVPQEWKLDNNNSIHEYQNQNSSYMNDFQGYDFSNNTGHDEGVFWLGQQDTTNNSNQINDDQTIQEQDQEQYLEGDYIYNKKGQTKAMTIASKGYVPNQIYNHNPEFIDKKGNTVAMLLAANGIFPPEQWKHTPRLCNNEKLTVEDLLSKHNIDPGCWKCVDEE